MVPECRCIDYGPAQQGINSDLGWPECGCLECEGCWCEPEGARVQRTHEGKRGSVGREAGTATADERREPMPGGPQTSALETFEDQIGCAMCGAHIDDPCDCWDPQSERRYR